MNQGLSLAQRLAISISSAHICTALPRVMALSENKQKMARGELYYAFTPELVAERQRCARACHRYNAATTASRRELVRLWRDVVEDTSPLPPKLPVAEEDNRLFDDDPWVEAPVHMDYGHNVKLASNVYINFNATFIDTCIITIGSRTMFGPNVSVYSGTHPLDPEIRQGTRGPETGKEIHIGEDVWIAFAPQMLRQGLLLANTITGGNVTILPGVNIGKGATVGAGSIVTKNIPAFHVAAGNPARIIRRIKTNMDSEQRVAGAEDVGDAAK